MNASKRCRCFLMSILLLQVFSVATSQSSLPHSSSTFRVRNVQGPIEGELNERQRKLYELQLTFSKEGDPLQLPIYQLQVFPTPIPVDSDSARSMDAALGDFFKTYFDAKYPNQAFDDNDNATTTVPQFDSVVVETVGVRTIMSEASRNRKRRQLQQQGAEFDVRTILRFEDGVFPEYSQLEQDVQSLFDDSATFLSDFLPAYTTTSLELVDTLIYVPGFTDPPTTAPTTGPAPTPPTENPTTDSNGAISEINESSQASIKNDRGIDSLYPALICGVIVFILTALWLAYRRNTKVVDIDMDEDYSAPIEHISVDYDGRQEALEIAKERQLIHQREQERLEQYQTEEIARRLRAYRSDDSQPSWYHSSSGNNHNHTPIPVQIERMEDGRTTIHISPETYGGDEDDYDDYENGSSMSQIPAINPSSSSPLALNMTSMSEESFYYDDSPAPTTGLFCSAAGGGHALLGGGSSAKSPGKYQKYKSMSSPNYDDLNQSTSVDSI